MNKDKRKKYIETFKEVLKKEGLKYTNQRLMVLNILLDNKGHFECDDIISKLAESGYKVSRATIYRTLDILVKYNFIRKLDIGDGKVRYEKKIGTSHHDHMICIDTGDIIEFCNNDIERIQNEIAYKHGYKIIRHVHQLFVRKK